MLSSPAPVQAVAGDDVTVDVDQEVAFDASGSTGAAPLQFLWFFGNGDAELGGLPSLSAERETTFAYSEEGVYEAILILTDGLGRVDVDSRVVTVRNVLPTAVVVVDALEAGAAVEVPEDTPVRFDGSGSEDTEGLLHNWDFGDGNEGAGAVVEHAYARRGTYVARLEVMDPKGAKDRAAVVVQVRNVAPEAAASFPSEAAEDERLTFDATATVDTPSDLAKLTYIWDLGDGTVELGREVEHAYGLSGAYRIRLQVIDDNGASSQVEDFLTIRNQAPVAVLPPLVVVEEEATVFFDASASTDTPSDVPLLNYSWDFDLDGKADAFGRRVTQVFDDEGDCLVRLVVQDDDGARASALTLVRVLDDEEDDPDELEDDEDDECAEEDDEDDDRLTVFEDEVVTFRPEDEDDGAVTFRWIFRDGTEAVGRVVEHAFAQAGTYHVLLVTTDEEREVEIDEFEVRVRNVPPWARIAPIGPAVEDALLLFDGRGTVDTPSDLPTLQYRWTFGDGSLGVGPVVSHAYPRAGRYAATLVVQDDNGAFSEASVEIAVGNVAPVASFDGPATVFVEEPALFVSTSEDTLSDEAALEIAWTLGDGTTAAGRELVHAFLAPGTFSVELAVTDDDGEVDLVAGTVEVQNRPPTAHIPFDLFMVYGEEGRASFRGLGFNGLSDQGSLSFSWDFGDGSSVTGREVVHSYAASGTFIATLTVTDQHGAVGTDTAVVNVILDGDLDGLPDLYESQVAGTDPQNADTDGDGILDSFELLVFETEPLLQDTDFDAWTDFEEVFAVHGYVTEPLDADSDDDGLPDGSELYTQAFKTAQRFAIPEQGSVTVALPGVATGAPPFAIETADARLGLVHPRAGDLDVTLNRNGDGRSFPVEVAFPGAPNLFVSVDLLEAGFIPAELTTPAKWSLQITNAGERGTVEYFEIHITARMSPVAASSDGDDLNDTEESNPGDDGWITDPWRTDTDFDGVSDALEARGWRRDGFVPVADPEGFRTDPTRFDTDRDGFADGSDLDPLHDLMIQLTIGEYEALDDDPDFDNCFIICLPDPAPEPFIEVEYKGASFYTPHKNPAGKSVAFNNVYTLDVPDDEPLVSFTLRAWDDDLALAADKQWDLDNTSAELDAVVSFNVLDGTTDDETVTGLGTDGDEGTCGTIIPGPDPNACRDASLTYRIDTVRLGRINTILVDSLDTDDLLETPTGDLRYLGDSLFYLTWINVTSPSAPLVEGLNAILVPRAQFFNSSFNHTLLTTADPDSLPAHLKTLTFTAFDESAEETANTMVGVLNGTLSGTEANLLLQGLIRGPDDVLNGNFTVVTDQLVTLGLPDRVVHAIPIQGVRFDETGDPPTGFLEGILPNPVEFLLQGLALIGAAIAAFFAEVVDFLVELGMAVIGAVAAFLGQVAEAVGRVGEVLLESVEAIVKQAERLIRKAIEPLLGGLSNAVQSMISSLSLLIQEALEEFSGESSSPTESSTTSGKIAEAILPLVVAIIAALTAIQLVEIIIVAGTGIAGFVISRLSQVALSIILSTLLVTIVVGTVPLVEDLIAGEEPQSFVAELFSGVGLFGAIAGAAFSLSKFVFKLLTERAAFVKRALGVALALIGFIVTLVSVPGLEGFELLVVDVVAAIISAFGLLLYLSERKTGVSQVTAFFAKFSAKLELSLALVGTGGTVLTILAHASSGAYDDQ